MFIARFLLFPTFLFTLNFAVFSQSENPDRPWQQYGSAAAGFKIDYPADWQIEKEEAKGQIWRITIISPGVRDDDVTMFDSITICSKPKGASFEDLDRCSNHHLHLEKTKINFFTTLNLNGIEVRRFETEDTYAPNASYFNAFFSTPKRDFLMTGYFSWQFNLERYIPVFDKMLKSFQPLEEKPVSIYRKNKRAIFKKAFYSV
jgi:hypothetical protein